MSVGGREESSTQRLAVLMMDNTKSNSCAVATGYHEETDRERETLNQTVPAKMTRHRVYGRQAGRPSPWPAQA